MKILLLCNKIPFPLNEGGNIAIHQMVDEFHKKGVNLRMLCIETPKFSITKKTLPAEYIEKTQIETVFVDTRPKLLPALRNLFSALPYNLTRFISDEYSVKLKEILTENEFDIVQFESVFMAPYIDVVNSYSSAKTVLRAHNIEHLIWNRLAKGCRNPLKKSYFSLMASRLKKYEQSIFNHFDTVLPITENDKNTILKSGCHKPMHVVPVGYNLSISDSKLEKPQPESVCHIGTMDWLPNYEGLMWYINNVWPKVREVKPNASLHIAGRNMPESIKQLKTPGLFVHGEVPDSKSFMRKHCCMVVPLLSGSGMRVKIIEALSLGIPLVTSAVGAEGIEVVSGTHLFVANTPAEFCEKTIELIDNEGARERFAENAPLLVADRYNPEKITLSLLSFYNNVLHGK